MTRHLANLIKLIADADDAADVTGSPAPPPFLPAPIIRSADGILDRFSMNFFLFFANRSDDV